MVWKQGRYEFLKDSLFDFLYQLTRNTMTEGLESVCNRETFRLFLY